MDPVVEDKCLPTLVVGDEKNIHRPLRMEEDRCAIIGLFVCGNKPHVIRRDPDENRHVVVAANYGGVPGISS